MSTATYNFSDLEYQLNALGERHTELVNANAYREALQLPTIPVFDLEAAKKACIKRVQRHIGGTSKYQPKHSNATQEEQQSKAGLLRRVMDWVKGKTYAEEA